MGNFDTSPTPERDEIAALKALITERDITVTSQRATIAILEEQLRLATHKQFAPSSEKLASLGHPDLFFNEAEALGTKPETDAQTAEIVVPAHTRERGKRKPIDAALPRKRIEHDISDAEKMCACGCQKTRIGEVISEQLDIEPAKALVLQHVRAKYACRACEGTDDDGPAVVTAPLPAQPLPKWTSPDLVESQLLFPVPCPVRCLERCWADVAQARVSSARVIEPLDVLANGVGGLLACRESGPPDQLGFDGLEDRFHHGVVVAVSPAAHRRDEAMVADDATVVC